MLVIRLSRTGRKNQPAYRLVVAEHSAPVQGKYLEIVGSYNPGEAKKIEFKEDRIKYWMSVGAKPSDTVASLLKTNGVEGMDEYIAPRDKQKKKKKEVEEVEEAAPAAEEGGEEAATEEVKEEPKEEAPAEEKVEEKAEEPVVEEEEKKEEEAPAEEAKEEEKPAEEEAPAEEEPPAEEAAKE